MAHFNDVLVNRLIESLNRGVGDSLELLRDETKAQSRVDTGKTKETYDYLVLMDKKGAAVTGVFGSNDMNAIYEEFGTGIYAEYGNGRKTPWVYYKNGKYYTTVGKRPNKPIRKAKALKKAEIIGIISESVREGMQP